jgi:hypothetical protein
VFVLDNRKAIWEELKNVNPELKQYFNHEFQKLLGNPYIEEWLSVHLEFETAAARARLILTAVKDIIELR